MRSITSKHLLRYLNKYLTLVQRYKSIVSKQSVMFSSCSQLNKDYHTNSHLLNRLNKVSETLNQYFDDIIEGQYDIFTFTKDIAKVSRMIGFVQATLSFQGLINLEEEIEATRELLA